MNPFIKEFNDLMASLSQVTAKQASNSFRGQAVAEASRGVKRGPLPESTKQAMSLAHRGQVRSAESRQNIIDGRMAASAAMHEQFKQLFLEGKSPEEIAALMGKKPGTVKLSLRNQGLAPTRQRKAAE